MHYARFGGEVVRAVQPLVVQQLRRTVGRRRHGAAPRAAADPAALLVGHGDGKPSPLLRYAGPTHLLTVAPTRSGKGVGIILPNLLLANYSVICVDPEGENARIAARARRRFGAVWVLDPFGTSGQPSASYDPTAALDLRSPDLAEEAATLASALVYDPPRQASEAHWNEEAKALVVGLLMHRCSQRGTTGQFGSNNAMTDKMLKQG